MILNKVKKGFTLIELIVVMTIISILSIGAFNIYNSRIAMAKDTTRVTQVNDLKGSIETFIISGYMSPPVNQHLLIEYGFMSALPLDPDSKNLYQYNADIRGYNSANPKQVGSNGTFLLASPIMVSSAASRFVDVEQSEFTSGTITDKSTDVKNLNYYGGYVVIGNGDAELLIENGGKDANNITTISSDFMKTGELGDCDASSLTYTPQEGVDGYGVIGVAGKQGAGGLCKIKILSSNPGSTGLYGPLDMDDYTKFE